MNLDQLQIFKAPSEVASLGEDATKRLFAMMEDKSDRTLIYGYTLERYGFHVYLKDGVIHRLVYGGDIGATEMAAMATTWPSLKSCVPDKRAYPAKCDYEFCFLLASFGVEPTFTTWEAVSHQQFYGALKEDFGL